MTKKLAPKKATKIEKERWMELSSSTKIRAEVTEFKGLHRIDIREHIETEKYTGFTKKGLNILTNKLPELIEHLQALNTYVNENNLINDLEAIKEQGEE